MVVVTRKNGHEYTQLPMEWRKKISWARVYTLDDGSKWTIDSLVKELTKRFPTKFIQKPMVVQRLRKHTSLDKIFAEPMDTKPSTKKVPQEVEDELLKLVLRTL